MYRQKVARFVDTGKPMTKCKACWEIAYFLALNKPKKSQEEHYAEVFASHKHNEQAGQSQHESYVVRFWVRRFLWALDAEHTAREREMWRKAAQDTLARLSQ
jgi:hypothetical protein